jgi:leader peptidase (prepilin peptidase)/N-methyltransferase
VILAEFPYWFLVGTVVALGLAFGSFLNVVIYRLPREMSLVRPASRCGGCGTPISARDNIPLLGWLLLRGKARCCKAPISPRYPLVELLGGLLAWALLECVILPLPAETAWYHALGLFCLNLALGLGLIAAAFIDLDHLYLPDPITLGGTVLGLATIPLRDGVTWQSSLLGAAIGFLLVWLPFDLLYRLLRGRPGMGMGDAKLLMLAGAWFGWQGALFGLLAGSVQGTITALTVFLAKGKVEEPEVVRKEREALLAEIEAAQGEEKERLVAELAADPLGSEPEQGLGRIRMPFGPFLVMAILEYQLFGAAIVDATLGYLWW